MEVDKLYISKSSSSNFPEGIVFRPIEELHSWNDTWKRYLIKIILSSHKDYIVGREYQVSIGNDYGVNFDSYHEIEVETRSKSQGPGLFEFIKENKMIPYNPSTDNWIEWK